MSHTRYAPTAVLERPTTPRWQVVAACETGTRHQQRSHPCEDACLCASRRDGTLILALADGAGCAAGAASGSALAVRAAVEAVAALPPFVTPTPDTLRGVLPRVRQALRETAAETTSRLADYATTLLVAVASERWLAVLQLGDGAVVVETHKGEVRTLTPPQRGVYHNETVFVTSEGALQQVQCAFMPAALVRGVALLSDGLESLALDLGSARAHPPFFAPLFAFARRPERSPFAKSQDLAAFLGSPRVCARTDDDKTLVLAVRT